MSEAVFLLGVVGLSEARRPDYGWNEKARRLGKVQGFKLGAILTLASRRCLLLLLLVSGCASQPDIAIEEQVGSRALQWADALMLQDYDRAVTYMTPTYQSSPRAMRFRGDFSGSAFWTDADIKWVKCDEEGDVSVDSSDTAVVGGVTASDGSESTPADVEDDCVITTWSDCGVASGVNSGSKAFNLSTAVSVSSRCEVRLILSVMKPPEMSIPLPIPYDAIWLNVEGMWYMYFK